MTTPLNPQEPFAPWLPAYIIVPEDKERLRTFLQEKLSAMSDVSNDKKIGAYTQSSESFNGEKWVYDTTKKVRNGYQTIARITSYPNTGTLTLTTSTNPAYPLTNVNPQFIVILTYGVANKPCSAVNAGDGDYFTFMNKGDSRISYTMSDTQIVITTTANLSAYSGFIVIHYLRDGT